VRPEIIGILVNNKSYVGGATYQCLINISNTDCSFGETLLIIDAKLLHEIATSRFPPRIRKCDLSNITDALVTPAKHCELTVKLALVMAQTEQTIGGSMALAAGFVALTLTCVTLVDILGLMRQRCIHRLSCAMSVLISF
jgi:hypothetical protein